MRPFMPLLLVLVSAVACSVAFARTGAAATTTGWASRVNAACIQSQVHFDRLPKSDGTVAQLLVVLPKLTTISANLLADVRRVPAAGSQRPAVTRLLRAWADEIAYDRVAYVRLKAGDMLGFQSALKRVFVDDKTEDTLLRALGSTCRRVP